MKSAGVLLFLVGLICGFGLHSVMPKTSVGTTTAVPITRSVVALQDQTELKKEVLAPSAAAPVSTDRQRYSISAEVIEAILPGTNLANNMLVRMGISEETADAIELLRPDARADFFELESSHVREISDERGDYLIIDAFPEQYDVWLAKLESKIHKLVPDDRAAIVARLIAGSDTDGASGRSERQVFVTKGHTEADPEVIEIGERDENGHVWDKRFYAITESAKERWGHLIDFESR